MNPRYGIDEDDFFYRLPQSMGCVEKGDCTVAGGDTKQGQLLSSRHRKGVVEHVPRVTETGTDGKAIGRRSVSGKIEGYEIIAFPDQPSKGVDLLREIPADQGWYEYESDGMATMGAHPFDGTLHTDRMTVTTK
jgi:hypothetical protein